MNKNQWPARVAVFLFPAESDHWLAVLRIGMGVQVCLYCFWLRRDWSSFLAGTGSGLLGRQISEALLAWETSLVPTLRWWVNSAQQLGMSEQAALVVCWLALLSAGICLALGVFFRPAAIVAWLLHLCVAKSGGFLSYGVDNFMTIGLFYLMLAPAPRAFSIWPQRSRKRSPDPQLLGFFRRVLQIHLCFVYFFSGLSKALGNGWWDGSNIWRALIRPPFNLVPPEFLVSWKFFLPLLGISIWAVELAYPVMISTRKTRTLWLVLVCAMHIGVGVAMGMYLFGLVMIVLNIAGFARFAPAPAKLPAAGG